jgi:hypothetical protein
MKIKTLNIDLVGTKVPDKYNGEAGRYIEDLLRQKGLAISTKRGPDTSVHNIPIEVKSRDVDSISAETVATMTPDEILKTPYEESLVCEKFQTQFRVYTKDNVVIKNILCNFGDHPGVQGIAKSAYENVRERMKNEGPYGTYYLGNKYAYFEQTGKSGLSFRFRKGKLEELEKMAEMKSEFNNLFEEE